jgi:hypothetical protein
LRLPFVARRGCSPGLTPRPAKCQTYLLSTESLLPKVTDAVKNGRPLTILVVGSRSSTIAASADSAYPPKLQARAEGEAALDPDQSIRRTTARENRGGDDTTLVKLVEAKRPTLVIWQTGTVDAMRSVDPTIFAAPSATGLLRCKTRGPMWF